MLVSLLLHTLKNNNQYFIAICFHNFQNNKNLPSELEEYIG